MAFDGIVTNSIIKELREKLTGGRLNKIHQPERDELSIQIRNNGQNYRLLISSSSNYPRIYLSQDSKENPSAPPNFCMVLRKHLQGGRIEKIEQFQLDRIVNIDISSMDELGQLSTKRLIVEIMGKHSNIILVNKDDYKIIDSIRKVSFDISRVRQILPGLIYQTPPDQNKIDPRKLNREDFLNILASSKDSIQVFKIFYQNYQGLSPLISREICFQAGIPSNKTIESLDEDDISKLYRSFENLSEYISNESYNPNYIEDEITNIIAFHALDLSQFPGMVKKNFQSISELLDSLYIKKDSIDRVSQRSQSIRKSIQTKLERNQSKLAKQKNEILASQDREKFKIYADLISANLYRIDDRKSEVRLENFYDPNMEELLVPLDSRYSAIENAQRYYKRYSKLKNAELVLKKQIPETENEILYLENVLINIENASIVQDLDEIVDELIDEGYIKTKKKRKNKKKTANVFNPHHYISRDGYDIYVGKNNKQNDYLTLRFSHKEDIWLHVQNMPGSHVIIKAKNIEIPPTSLEDAALLAAFYSKAKYSSNIAVDYTERKNVRKIPNSKPGLVRYENFKTLIVTPNQEAINMIKKVEN